MEFAIANMFIKTQSLHPYTVFPGLEKSKFELHFTRQYCVYPTFIRCFHQNEDRDRHRQRWSTCPLTPLAPIPTQRGCNFRLNRRRGHSSSCPHRDRPLKLINIDKHLGSCSRRRTTNKASAAGGSTAPTLHLSAKLLSSSFAPALQLLYRPGQAPLQLFRPCSSPALHTLAAKLLFSSLVSILQLLYRPSRLAVKLLFS